MKLKTYNKYIIFILLILVSFIIFFLFYKNNIIDNFTDFGKINTVCLVWSNKKTNTKTNHGFGDKIRGLIYAHRYFKTKNNSIEIMVDATNDICGDILKNVKSKFTNIINDVKINYITKEDDMNSLEIYNNDTIFMYTNISISDKISDEEKNIAKYISEPNTNIKVEIENKLLRIPNNFTIKHFRFNDAVFKKDVDQHDTTFKTFFDFLKRDYLETDILITNSKNFTKYAIEKLNIKYIDCDNNICDVGHIGESTDYNTVKNSYIEYYIISKSKKIMSYTCYPGVSNFVLWPSKIYDIPFESIELNTTQY